MQHSSTSPIKFIDLFAGMGGTRLGFEMACAQAQVASECVFTSELKDYAIKVYQENFGFEEIRGDINLVDPIAIPDHDVLLAGFPCQPFSFAGKRQGFADSKGRGHLFLTTFDILAHKQPEAFLLENVEGLVKHDGGNTLNFMVEQLTTLGYKVSWQLLDASHFGIPQQRKRVYIVGHKGREVALHFAAQEPVYAGFFLEDVPFEPSDFSQLLMKNFSYTQLRGKAIKDKRGGANNIHSWDLALKGPVSEEQKQLLRALLTQRRSKRWAEAKNIEWMDGMPLTFDEIATFSPSLHLQDMLDDLCAKGYLSLEHPKQLVEANGIKKRIPHTVSPKGYNIVAGKLSFPFAKIIDPDELIPTIVATEVGKIAVATPQGVRSITVREGLRFSGFPDSYTMSVPYRQAFDLIGNTVMPPVIEAISLKIMEAMDEQ